MNREKSMNPVRIPETTRRRISIGLAGLLAILFAVTSCGPPPAGSGGGTGGMAAVAPDLTLPKIAADGDVRLRADGAGKVVLVDLWATWCVPCVAELPHLQELSDSLPDDDFLMLGILLESGDAEDVAPFIAEHGLTYPNVMGSDAARDSFGPFLGYPTKYLIDRDGNLVKRYLGAVGDILNEEVGKLIETGSLDD